MAAAAVTTLDLIGTTQPMTVFMECTGSIYSHLVPEICYERLIHSVTVKSFRHGKSPPNKGGRTMKKVKAHTRHSVVTAEHLAHKMNIGLEKANQMIISTTHRAIQTAVHPINCPYRVDHLDLHTPILSGELYVDWIYAGTK